MIIPQDAQSVLSEFSIVFTQPTYQRFLLLLVCTIVTTGRRTVSNVLRTVGELAKGNPSSFHRFLSQAKWSGLKLACVLARVVVATFCPNGPIFVAGDDTVDEHRGKKVYGKSRHRDPVRSSKSYTAHRYGHKWIVAAVLVRLPLTSRDWALPVLVDLYRSPAIDKAEGRRHRTPVQLMERMLRVLLRWFPDREIVFTGDGSFGTHELARFAAAQDGHLSLVSRFFPDANLYEPPPPKSKKAGRPRCKGKKLASPQEVVAATRKRRRVRVAWYGGGTRWVEIVTGTGYWYKSGHGLVEVRWVYVHDCTGTHRDDYLFSTDVGMTPEQIIEIYTRRWNIETTFQEMRSHLGLETTRGWKRETVLRAAPCLFGLYSIVVLLYFRMPSHLRCQIHLHWEGKRIITFSDAITSVRRWLWTDCIFETAGHGQALSKLPPDLCQILLNALAPAP